MRYRIQPFFALICGAFTLCIGCSSDAIDPTPTLLLTPISITAEVALADVNPLTPTATVPATSTPIVTAVTPTQESSSTPEAPVFLPIVSEPYPAEEPTATWTPIPPTPTATPTPIPTLDFSAISAELDAQGKLLATNKIGFHVAVGGNQEGVTEWVQRSDEAGVPIFLKSVGNAGPLYEVQEMMKESGVPHVLVYRFSGDLYDTPNYDLPPAQAAAEHWERHTSIWPPELDKDIVWLETINEVDKNESEWLAEFALETAKLAERDGFKWAAFGWASGEPEISHWESPKMLEFLRLTGSNPDRLAIAVHEYSYIKEDIADQYPFKVGRFLSLFDVVDRNGIPRPTVLITEWGWEYVSVPEPSQAMADIEWANQLYTPFPEIKGAAIWYLGPGYGPIADEAQKLIEPVMIFGLTNAFSAEPGAPTSAERYQPN